MTQRPRKKVKPERAWGVFESGRLCFVEACDEYDATGESHFTPLVYRHKKDAKKRGQDYRRVRITVKAES